MPAHAFVSRKVGELPPQWLTEPTEQWFSTAAEAMDVPRADLVSTVFFELPDCSMSRLYMHFCMAAKERDDGVVLVALTNPGDFGAAHGPDSVMEALNHMHVRGFPCHCIRIAHKK